MIMIFTMHLLTCCINFRGVSLWNGSSSSFFYEAESKERLEEMSCCIWESSEKVGKKEKFIFVFMARFPDIPESTPGNISGKSAAALELKVDKIVPYVWRVEKHKKNHLFCPHPFLDCYST